MRKFVCKLQKMLLFGAFSSLCTNNTVCVDNTQEIDNLRKDLVACMLQRTHFLHGVDRTQCLPKICALYKQLHQIEQKAQVTPVKNAEGLAICELAQAQTEAHQNKLCSDLVALDHSITQFREKHHRLFSAFDRNISKLSKQFIDQFSSEDRKEFEKINSQYKFLRQRLLELGEKPLQHSDSSPYTVLNELFL